MRTAQIITLAALAALAAYGQTAKSQAELYTQFADGQTRTITAAYIRNFVASIVPATKTEGTLLRFGASNAVGVTAWTVPATDGTNGQVLTTNGAGVTSWATPTGGSGSGDLTGLSGSSSLSSWGAIGAGAQACKNITISGVVGGDAVAPKVPSTLESGLRVDIQPFTDGVKVCLFNATAGSISPADGQTFGAQIIRSTI